MSECNRCPHDFDPHRIIATMEDPMQGGIILCQETDCRCFGTWAPSHPNLPVIDPDAIYIPSMEEIEAMRAAIWRGEL